MKALTWEGVEKYIPKESKDNLHPEAFMTIFNHINDYIQKSVAINSKIKEDNPPDYLRHVLDAKSGHGKTEGLKTILIYYASQRVLPPVPMLLCFNNERNLDEVFDYIEAYGHKNNIKCLAKKIVADNASDEQETALEYQFLFITSHRLSDLALDIGTLYNFLYYKPEQEYNLSNKKVKAKKRTVIVDEIPIFFDSQIFDVGKKNNCIDWLDEWIQNDSSLEDDNEIAECRNIIVDLFTDELRYTNQLITQNLARRITGTKEYDIVISTLSKMYDEEGKVKIKDAKRLKWFERLFHYDDIGAFEKTKEGKQILCSQFVDHFLINANILVLDATAKYHKIFYDKAGFSIINIPDFHNYNRLQVKHMKVNTKSNEFNQKDKPLQELLSNHIHKTREYGEKSKYKIKLIALMKKSLIDDFITSGVILPEQRYLFEKSYENESPINMGNLVGCNSLNQYNTMALLHLPQRAMTAYRLLAIGMYGIHIDLSKSPDKDKWFNDDLVEEIFKETMKSDLYQIVMRTSLRIISNTDPVFLFLYTIRNEWVEYVREIFELPQKNITSQILKLGGKNNFSAKCRDQANKILEVMKSHNDGWNNPVVTTSQVGRGLVDFMSRYYTKEGKESYRDIIIKEFEAKGLTVYLKENSKKKQVIHIEKVK